jgi:hypothetical protein
MTARPPALDCGHSAEEARRVCPHLLRTREADYLRRFTGAGLAYDLLCHECRGRPAHDAEGLRTACPACFRAVEEDGCWEGIVGRPQVLERESGLSFGHETVAFPELRHERLLDVQPASACDQNHWVAITRSGRLFRLNLDCRSVLPLCPIPEAALTLSEPVSLHVSADGRSAAVVNARGRSGALVDLAAGHVVLALDRGDYHNEHCTFPAAFCTFEGRSLLIHGTEWNRLDVSDARTGELLTARAPTAYRHGEARPEHYLDYFHCGLCVSPDQEYVADNGWVWSPVGLVTAWSVRRWLGENVWEAEDGPSKKSLCQRAYFWDGPLCWAGDRRLAVWGYGDDEEWHIPAVRLFDVTTGAEERWFAGPNGELVFDELLFSTDAHEGTSAWDVGTGERLLRDAGLGPVRYHQGAKCFLTVRPDGVFQVSRLRGRPVDAGWLSWNGGTVARLARTIADEGVFDQLPVLADALEEAGCGDAAVLAHCRRPGPHSGRCWVTDLIVGAAG